MDRFQSLFWSPESLVEPFIMLQPHLVAGVAAPRIRVLAGAIVVVLTISSARSYTAFPRNWSTSEHVPKLHIHSGEMMVVVRSKKCAPAHKMNQSEQV